MPESESACNTPVHRYHMFAVLLIVANAISAKDNGDGAALRWLPGYCATTEFSSRMAVCSTDTSGAWHMLPTDDEVAGRRRCAKRCTRCRNCRFVSYSRQDNDCSWYADCRLGGLRDSPSGHHSAQVKRGISDELARQRQSRPQPPHAPPTALMIYHIAKTGGTALGSLLNGRGWQARRHELRQQGQRLSLPLVLSDGLFGCFFALFPALFPEYDHAQYPGKFPEYAHGKCAAAWKRGGYTVGGRPVWQRHAIAVEFHTRLSRDAFFETLEPKLPQLRLLYAAHSGTILTTTTVRSPRAIVRSTYKMWPPRVPAETAKGAAATAAGGFSMELRGTRFVVLPFGYMLEQRPPWAAQTNQLLSASGLEASECADGNTTNWISLELARRRLRSFDEVGVTECTRRYYRRLGARLGWPNLVDESIMNASEAHDRNDWYKPVGKELFAAQSLRPWVEAQADLELEPQAEAALIRAVSCDAAVYADGLWLGGLLKSTDGTRAQDGDEHAWLAAAQVVEPPCAAA